MSNKWDKILDINYEKKGIENRLKWSKEEYKNGKWKTGISKVYEITSLKETDERVAEVAEIMNISEDMSRKYFQRVCGECGKKLNPGEIGMFLKTQGRYEDKVDDRDYLCKKHLSSLLGISGKEYVEMRKRFSEAGCDLF